jgi:hypothetical protein
MENTNTNYILGGTGYTALLAAIVEQAKYDATHSKDPADVADALAGIAEWKEEVESNLNFKVYE